MTTDPVLRAAVPAPRTDGPFAAPVPAAPSVPVLQVGSPAWRDRLVELHVLAEHGDVEAATEAERWLAEDDSARRHWELVERDCLEIHPRRV